MCLIVPIDLRLNAIGYNKIHALKTVLDGLVKLSRQLLVAFATKPQSNEPFYYGYSTGCYFKKNTGDKLNLCGNNYKLNTNRSYVSIMQLFLGFFQSHNKQ